MLPECGAPLLELWDLDEHYSTEKARLAQLTHKCTDEDLEFYVRECGEVLGVMERLSETGDLSARRVLDAVFKAVVRWKKVNC